jgi:hypothetical protein
VQPAPKHADVLGAERGVWGLGPALVKRLDGGSPSSIRGHLGLPARHGICAERVAGFARVGGSLPGMNRDRTSL